MRLRLVCALTLCAFTLGAKASSALAAQPLTLPSLPQWRAALEPILTLRAAQLIDALNQGHASASRCALLSASPNRVLRCEQVRWPGRLDAATLDFEPTSGQLVKARDVTGAGALRLASALRDGPPSPSPSPALLDDQDAAPAQPPNGPSAGTSLRTAPVASWQLYGVRWTPSGSSDAPSDAPSPDQLLIERGQLDEQGLTWRGVRWLDARGATRGQAALARADAQGRWRLEQLALPRTPTMDALTLSQDEPATSALPDALPGLLPPGLSLVPEAKLFEVSASAIGGQLGQRALLWGVRAAPGQHAAAQLALVQTDALDSPGAMTLSAGYDLHHARWMAGALGQARLGQPLHHLSLELEAPGSDSLWQAQRLSQDAWLRPWRRRRAGVALHGPWHELTLLLSSDVEDALRDEPRAWSAPQQTSATLRLSASYEQASWALAQVQLEHVSLLHAEQPGRHGGQVWARQTLTWGQRQRAWMSASGALRHQHMLARAEQGWTTQTSASAQAQLEAGLTLLGRPWRQATHTLSPRLLALVQPTPLVRQDSLLASAPPRSWRSPALLAALHLDQDLRLGSGLHLALPTALWLGAVQGDDGQPWRDALWMGSARLASAHSAAHMQASLLYSRGHDRAQLELSLGSPAFFYGLAASYHYTNQGQLGLVGSALLHGSQGSALWQDGLWAALDPQPPAAARGAHLAGLSWQPSPEHSAQLMLVARGASPQGALAAYTLWWPQLGWGVEAAAARDQTRDGDALHLVRLGLRLSDW